jgi:hypothetical protein
MDAGREAGAFVDDSKTLLTRQSPQASQQSSSLSRRQSVKQDQYAASRRQLSKRGPSAIAEPMVGDQPLPGHGLAARHSGSYSAVDGQRRRETCNHS